MFGKVDQIIQNGLEVVELRSLDGNHCCQVYLHGATLTSWIKNGEEKIYMSSKAVYDGVKALRGGVPLVFPQFARPDPSMAQHGFVRNSKWRYIDAINGDDTITAYFVLTNADVSTSWPFLFTNVFEVTLSADSLSYSMRIFNTDSREFSYQTLLHTYIRTPRIEEISISGVQNWEFYDKVDNNSKKLQTDSNIFIASEVDRVYVGESQNPANPNIKLTIHHQPTNSIYLTSQSYASLSNYDSSLLNLLSKESLPTFEINIKGLESKPQISDVVVWNAWEAKCKALDDLDDDAYFHYVCIEPGLVAKQHFLGPNQVVCMTQSLF